MGKADGRRSLLVGLIWLALLPAQAAAQSAIAGLVTDNTGAVLPGVTVEAASPVLIEKVRTALTDGQGRYTIVNLRPGTYKVTFNLVGFSSVVRDDIVLPGDFTATVNVQLSVGALAETVTVSGQSPLVDIQSAARTQVITRDVLDALPTPRNTQSFGYLMQGVRLSRPDVGGAQMMEQVNMRVHGASQLHTTMQIDGMLVSPAFSDGAIQNYLNQAHFAETAFTTSSQSAEVAAGGIRLNMIPRDGGNTFHGDVYLGGTAGSWQSNNLTDELRAKGLTLPTSIQHIQDFNPSIGGPILRDRLWFFGSFRWMSVNEIVANAYMPDGSPAIVDQHIPIPLARLTYQATPKNKLSVFLDRPFKYKGREFTFGIEPSRASRRRNPGEANYHNLGAKFTSTVTNRILYELGFTQVVERLHSGYQPAEFPTTRGWPRPANVRSCLSTPCPYDPGIDQTGSWYRDVSHWDIITRQRTVATTGYSGTLPDRNHITTALSYVTGSHNFKTGFQWSFGQDRNDALSHGDLQEQRYRNGVPESVVVTINPFATEEYVKADIGIYVQDTWRRNRLTITPGLRYEYFNSMIKQQGRPEGRFVPGAIFPEIAGVPIWHDITPRFGLAYDVFGDGKTAAKFAANKYTRPMAGSFAKRYNPLRSGAVTDVRDWFDCALIPGTSRCDPALANAPTNHDGIVQDWEIGPPNNRNFGKAAAQRFAPGIKREYNVELAASLQRELFDRLSVTGAWYRRQYYRLIGSQNQAIDAAKDWIPFQVASPLGTGEMITIYNFNPAKRGLVDILDTNSDTNTQISNDFELSFQSRLPKGSTLFGGWNASRNQSVTCDQDNPNGSDLADLYYDITLVRGGRFCDERKLGVPFRHDFKLAGTLPLPYDFEFSGTIVSFAGNETQTVWEVPASVFPNGQRTLATRVRLTPPGTKYLNRWNQVDIAFKRIFRLNGYRLTAQADIYNALNGSVVTSQTEVFGSTLDFPNTILQGRLLRLVAQVKW